MPKSPVEKIFKYGQANRPLWKVPNWGESFKLQCAICARDLPDTSFMIVEATGTHLLYGVRCKTCRNKALQKTRVDTKHPLYSDELLAFAKKIFRSAKAGAFSRKLNFAITEEFIVEMFFEQDGRCALTGVPLEYTAKKRGKFNLSVDRISSDGGYEPCNVQLVCFAVNVMKRDMPQEVFVNWCRLVVENDMIKATKAA